MFLKFFRILKETPAQVVSYEFCKIFKNTLKADWHFTKWDGLNVVFVIQYIQCFKNFWGSANILL